MKWYFIFLQQHLGFQKIAQSLMRTLSPNLKECFLNKLFSYLTNIKTYIFLAPLGAQINVLYSAEKHRFFGSPPLLPTYHLWISSITYWKSKNLELCYKLAIDISFIADLKRKIITTNLPLHYHLKSCFRIGKADVFIVFN